MTDLSSRIRLPELMDDTSGSAIELDRALRTLTLLNTLSLSAYLISNAIVRLLGLRQQVIRILDFGAGRGDILCSVADRLKKRGYRIDAIGIDMNPKSTDIATQYAKAQNSSARFLPATALDAAKNFDYDVAISSLFLHHLSEDEILSLFSAINERASIGLVMSDLERSSVSYALTWLATHTVSRSHMIHYDGLVSVQGALTREEFLKLAARAGLQNFQAYRTFPFRTMITWKKDPNAVDAQPK